MNNQWLSNLKHIFWLTKQALWYPRLFRYYKYLLHNSVMSQDELLRLSIEKRKAIINFAIENVPFYSNYPKLDFTDDHNWQRIPILKRDDVVKNFDKLIVNSVKDQWLSLVTTGGTTGTPVKVYHDKRYPITALGWRMMKWWGVSPSMDEANCWRRTPSFAPSENYSWLNKMGIVKKRIFLNAADMNDETIKDFINQFIGIKPAILQGYVGAIDALADDILSKNYIVPSPKAIWLTASPSTRPQRLKIENAFHGPTYDQYGCSEIYYIAAECKLRNGLHVFSDARFVEIVDENNQPCPPGQIGRLLITDLENRVFPLVRYENGDRASFLDIKCDCGLPFSLISPVKGRISDNILLPNGSVLAGEFLTTLFDDIPDFVSAFQVLQNAPDKLVIRVVAKNGGEEKIADTIENFKNNTIKGAINIQVEMCESIEHDRGKSRFVVRDW